MSAVNELSENEDDVHTTRVSARVRRALRTALGVNASRNVLPLQQTSGDIFVFPQDSARGHTVRGTVTSPTVGKIVNVLSPQIQQ